jgi:hypothetical protein
MRKAEQCVLMVGIAREQTHAASMLCFANLQPLGLCLELGLPSEQLLP